MRALAAHLAALILVLLLAAPQAFAQAEERGYGGPSTVGPNFSTGKQSAPPDYGTSSPQKKPAYKPARTKKAAKPAKPAVKSARKPPAKSPSKPNDIAKSPDPATPGTPAKTETPTETATPVSDNPAPAVKPETCRRFDATTGTTLEVACD